MTADADPDPWISFVHGSTTDLWKASASISGERGKGDFGIGFYVFEDTNWGRQSAVAWARRKSVVTGGDPILVRVRIRRSTFLSLDREDISDEGLATAYNVLHRIGRTGRQLIVGPVGKRGNEGWRVPDRSLPSQYKFEGTGVAHLVLDAAIPAQ